MVILLRVFAILFALIGVWFTLAVLIGGGELLELHNIWSLWMFFTFLANSFCGFVASVLLFRLRKNGLVLAGILLLNTCALSALCPLYEVHYSRRAVVVISVVSALSAAILFSPAARRSCTE